MQPGIDQIFLENVVTANSEANYYINAPTLTSRSLFVTRSLQGDNKRTTMLTIT